MTMVLIFTAIILLLLIALCMSIYNFFHYLVKVIKINAYCNKSVDKYKTDEEIK